PAVGRLRRYSARSGTVDATEYSLPRRASRHLDGLRLTSPRSALLRLGEDALYAAGPEPVGDRRLRTTLISIASTPEDERREAWSRLPTPERVQWSWFEVLDGRPVLIVTTNSAKKLGVLERQNLRLFSLRGDRTQAGAGPWLTAQTSSRRWQRVEPWVVDIEQDGDEDLVVAQFDGLGSGKVKLEAFVNAGDRRFLARSRRTVIERAAASWHFGDDLTGDGLPDLVLYSEGALEIYPALDSDSARLVARRPRWSFAGGDIPRVEHSVELGAGGIAVHDDRPSEIGVPRALDVDGDGRRELLLAENPQWGFGRLRVVFLPPSS
ncbi:MAG: VCBS repeat-containing protein, partial [Myxococcales bacterium]|nr:VCBS repeat-containing protein [Myxococcales bacterium]